MGKIRVAIPTRAHAGLEDTVSEVFGKAKTFTIVEVENSQIKNVHVIENPAASYEYGAGPVAVKTLADLQVNFVLSVELGPGASGLLEHHQIQKIAIKPNTKVIDAINENLKKLKI
jgi:predicted Fe-Mo cluster-binding NifX family protein